MNNLHQASVWSPIDHEHDGLRILVTRYVPRGCRRSQFDVWMANLGPSERLLKRYRAQRIGWEEFARRYREELFQGAPIDEHNPRIKNHGQKFTLRLLQTLAQKQRVTLMCDCDDDEPHCHRHILKKIIDGKV